MLQRVVEGYHATIFAYGQTGSGKTHTMEGNSYKTDKSNSTRANAKTVVIQKDTQSMGITQRSIQELWNQVEHKRNHEGKHITIQVSFLQIYNEKVFDLLNLSHLSKPSSDNNGL